MECCMYVQRILFYCKEKVNCIYVGVNIEGSKLEKTMRSQNRDFRERCRDGNRAQMSYKFKGEYGK